MDKSFSRGWRRANMYDVARRAGVSHQTVSRVVNEHPEIRDATRARVLKAIEESNYAPNLVARALAIRRVRRIGVLVGGSGHDGPNLTLRGLENAARKAGYGMSAVSVDDGAPQIESAVVELVDQGVEALCVIAPRQSLLGSLQEQEFDLPTVVVQTRGECEWPSVGIDQREGARLAVSHLIGLGHRTIAHVAGPMDWIDARERRWGWQDCLAEAGLQEGPLIIGDWTSGFGFEFGRSFDARGATAIFAGNDRIALGVVHGLHSRGIRVPRDVSVVGFDNLSDTHHFLPPLTTIRQDFTELGKLALRSVIAALNGHVEPSRSVMRPTLVVRQSTAALGDARPV